MPKKNLTLKDLLIKFVKMQIYSSCISVLLFTYLYQSSFIANRIKEKLLSQGTLIEDFTGSPAKGFEAKNLVVKNESFTLEIGKLQIKITDYLKLFTEKLLTFESLEFSNSKISLKEVDAESFCIGVIGSLFSGPDQKSTDDPLAQPQNRFEKFSLQTVVIKNISVKSAQIIDLQKTSDLNLEIRQFQYSVSDKSFTWSSSQFALPVADWRTQGVEYKQGSFKLHEPLAGELKTFPGFKFTKAIDFAATFSVEDGQINNLQLNAFSSQLTLTLKKDSPYQLWLNEFRPAAYFENLPLDKISLYSTKPSLLDLFAAPPASASFQIGTANFTCDPQIECLHQTGVEFFKIKFPPGFLITVLTGNGKIELSNSNSRSLEESLRYLNTQNPSDLAKYFVLDPVRLPTNQPELNQFDRHQ